MLTKEELVALDNWRFDRRMPSRAAAVRELLRLGLSAEGFVISDGSTKSGDFGVISDPDAKPRTSPEGDAATQRQRAST
jgi:hypothetical protein